MADNVELNPGAGGTFIAADEIAGVQYPRGKFVLGADGVNDGDVSATNGMPITGNTVKDGSGTEYRPLVDADGHMQVDVLNNADPATETTLAAIAGYLDTEVAAIVTAVEILDNAIAGTEMQVDIVASLPAGTNAIGKLAANDGVDIGDVDVTSQPARDRLTDNVGVALQTDVLLNDVTALTPKFAAINATVSGDNTLVAAVVGKKIRVLSYVLVADAAVGAAFEDGAGGTELTGQMAFAANGGVSVPFSPLGHFETTANALLNLELDAAANVRGHLCYVEV